MAYKKKAKTTTDTTTDTKKSFSMNMLDPEQKKDFVFAQRRIGQLKRVRINHYGHNIDNIWADADRDYIPHRLKKTGTKMTVEDEDKGWRGNRVNLQSSDAWQSDLSQANVFIKIQTALSILVDQNPTGEFSAASSKFQAYSDLIKQLYSRSWETAKSKTQLKLFTFNLAKYGWAVARSYPLRIEREVKVCTEYNEQEPEKSKYEKKMVCEYNDIYRENLDPRNTWLDDMAKPNNQLSINDWCWRKVYTYEDAKAEFGKYSRFEYVQAGSGVTTETVNGTNVNNVTGEPKLSDDLVEVYFYENRAKDLFYVEIGGVPVIMDPLPVADIHGNKRLSVWQTYWNLRHSESPYGVGIYEAMRFDQALLDRLRNMTTDQLTLSIYKMFFYQGTQNLLDTGDITIRPGVGKQVLDPKGINWLEVPGPGAEAWQGIDSARKSLDESSSISDALQGNITGKTAFELAQAKEAALKRLKNPLDNILEALNEEAYLTVCLIQLIYSVPEVFHITDPELMDAYLQEVQADPDLWERVDNESGSDFMAKVYREFPLNLDKDEKGNLIETKDSQFFRVKPHGLDWSGIVNIKSQSILTPSKQVDKAQDLELFNMLIPLLSQISQERMMAQQTGQSSSLDDLPHGKIAKELIKDYDKDPKDILPSEWFIEQPPQQQMQLQQPEQGNPNSLFIPAQQGQDQGQAPQAGIPSGNPQGTQAPSASLFIPSTKAPSTRPQGIAAKMSAQTAQAFR